MYMLIRMPLACFLIIAYAFIYYKRNRRLNTRSSRVFEILTISSMIHTLSAVITEYTVNCRDKVSSLFNLTAHILFLLSLLACCFLLYFYLLCYVERGLGKGKRKERVVSYSVWAAVSLAILVLPIEYIDTPYGSYSLGPKAYALYVGIGYTLAMMLFNVAVHYNAIRREKRDVVLSSIAIFTVIFTIQLFLPHILLTSLGITMIVLGVMLTVEDSRRYFSRYPGLFNEMGCREVLDELLCTGGTFSVKAWMFMGNSERVAKSIEHTGWSLAEKAKLDCCLLSEDILVILPPMTGSIPQDIHPFEAGSDVHVVEREIRCDEQMSALRIIDSLFQLRDKAEDINTNVDELTGLLRRNEFVRRTSELILDGTSFTFLMIDVDSFKEINDNYGHAVGDAVLRSIGDVFNKSLRDKDVICRMGGDEFAILLYGVTDTQRVREIVARISGEIGRIHVEGSNVRVSLSIGIRLFDGVEAMTFDDIYREADSALYRAKRNGKRQYAFAQEK